ncbi:hypothetical protein MKS85_27585 [Pseudomonas sp. JL2]|uniref:hypothetical protein n=1 Tax=Pseudomonas sp. JL2 TaxID=2919942 RepID=UPI0028553783|nr:hypothetical protein [Pseudomonas sp. JL2]MDR8389273.1 hypothetical protein [Pseudomonas sp. JL2]
MNRQTYLALPHVSQFTDWLAAELDSKSHFTHEYVDRRTGAQWSCNSLFDAFAHYRWNHPGNSRLAFNPGNCSMSNGFALTALRKDLDNLNGNDSRALDAALDVMSWGGVIAGNATWLKANKIGLASLLKSVQAAMDAGDELAPALRSKHLRFNSGMTKVYSLCWRRRQIDLLAEMSLTQSDSSQTIACSRLVPIGGGSVLHRHLGQFGVGVNSKPCWINFP